MPLNPAPQAQAQAQAQAPAASFRLQALTSHLSHPTTHQTTPTMATKDPITCHVLDTTTGRPAARMIVTLSCTSSTSPTTTFTAVTNGDGRIAKWDAEVGGATIESLIKQNHNQAGGSSIWQLRFNTGAYYGAEKTFWPWVELTFYVREGEHYHVPLLLGPYSYTTYRGS